MNTLFDVSCEVVPSKNLVATYIAAWRQLKITCLSRVNRKIRNKSRPLTAIDRPIEQKAVNLKVVDDVS